MKHFEASWNVKIKQWKQAKWQLWEYKNEREERCILELQYKYWNLHLRNKVEIATAYRVRGPKLYVGIIHVRQNWISHTKREGIYGNYRGKLQILYLAFTIFSFFHQAGICRLLCLLCLEYSIDWSHVLFTKTAWIRGKWDCRMNGCLFEVKV